MHQGLQADPSPASLEREGPARNAREGEVVAAGVPAVTTSPASLALGTLSSGAGEGKRGDHAAKELEPSTCKGVAPV